MRPSAARPVFALLLLLAGCTTPPPSSDRVPPNLAKVEHIVVLYAENRSFDNLYGLYPGANGLGNATAATWTQSDRNGTTLPVLPPVWTSTATPDPTYPKNLPNRPFRIDAPPINQPLSVATPRPRFTASIPTRSNSTTESLIVMRRCPIPGGLTMGYYDGSTAAAVETGAAIHLGR